MQRMRLDVSNGLVLVLATATSQRRQSGRSRSRASPIRRRAASSTAFRVCRRVPASVHIYVPALTGGLSALRVQSRRSRKRRKLVQIIRRERDSVPRELRCGLLSSAAVLNRVCEGGCSIRRPVCMRSQALKAALLQRGIDATLVDNAMLAMGSAFDVFDCDKSGTVGTFPPLRRWMGGNGLTSELHVYIPLD